jgi:hypothetical protein
MLLWGADMKQLIAGLVSGLLVGLPLSTLAQDLDAFAER